MTYYAVAKGRRIGVFTNWSDVKGYVIGFNGPKFRKFDTKEEAEAFVLLHAKPETSYEEHDVSTPIRETDSILIAFCDGACSQNGKQGAKAGYSSVWPWHENYDGGWPLIDKPRTNNRAEFSGLIKTFEIADMIDPSQSKEVLVFTDSMFLIRCFTEWMPKWKRNGFKKSDGTNVLNQDLLVVIDDLMNERRVTLKHVKAHTGKTDWVSIQNDKADKLAKYGVTRCP
uniref:ribonuclease H n=1 Tax=viral metagenome TaxID=1070528 RepID=A0A6C0BF99_9ZZZZ